MQEGKLLVEENAHTGAGMGFRKSRFYGMENGQKKSRPKAAKEELADWLGGGMFFALPAPARFWRGVLLGFHFGGRFRGLHAGGEVVRRGFGKVRQDEAVQGDLEEPRELEQ